MSDEGGGKMSCYEGGKGEGRSYRGVSLDYEGGNHMASVLRVRDEEEGKMSKKAIVQRKVRRKAI